MSENGFVFVIYFTDYLGDKRRNVELHSHKWMAKEQLGYLDRIHNEGIDENDPNQKKYFAIEDIPIENMYDIEIRSLPRRV